MFSNVSSTWLDGSFYNALRYIDGMFAFFMKQTRILAMICFALSFGIACVKMVLGATELNKVLTQALMSIVTYLLMIFLFPHIMINMQKIISDLAYGAVFSQGVDIKLESKYGKEADFFEYLNELGTDKNGNTIWSVSGNSNDARRSINLQITYKETGLVSLNKLFQMIIATFKALWKSLDIKNIGDFFKHFPDFLMIIIISLAYVWSLSVAVANYTMVVVQYASLYGMGVLFIPLMLWEGTKHAFEKLCGSIYNIGVKLLVVQIALYLAAMANIDILKNMFVLSGGKVDFMQGIEFYLSTAFMVIFIKLFVDNAPAIADFLCGGQPTFNIKDFAAAVGAGAAAGAFSSKSSGSTVKGAESTGSALLSKLKGGDESAGRTKSGNTGNQSLASLGNAGGIGQSTVQGGASKQIKSSSTASNVSQSSPTQGSQGSESGRGLKILNGSIGESNGSNAGNNPGKVRNIGDPTIPPGEVRKIGDPSIPPRGTRNIGDPTIPPGEVIKINDPSTPPDRASTQSMPSTPSGNSGGGGGGGGE